MNTYTPGPWEIDWVECKTGDEVHWKVPTTIGPISPDHNHWSGPYLDVEEADAYLIAAAPDLLEALQHLLNTMFDGPDESDAAHAVSKAREAIAKAKGEV